MCQIPIKSYCKGLSRGASVWYTTQAFAKRTYSGFMSDICKNTKYNGEIHGTEDKGWKLFLENGQFYISPEMMTLSVVVIGGGGGGFDNSTLLSLDNAGRGEDSMFLDVFAEGGKGGTLQRGGKGGGGNVYDGKDGGQENSCSTIKNCNKVNRIEKFLRIQHDYSPTSIGRCACCKINENDIDVKRGNTYTTLCDLNGMEFGVGGQGNSGWSGGDGGISCNMIYKDEYPEHRTVDIQVGKGGSPSYTTAGNGMVLITWGMGNACVVL
ncbi:unnamed protein product [Mytilus coruscus]|uniref:Uncharacterized protein n=1 Tax=Mytilus coruscus TaxID=42192 RepID=A0A6J8BZM9_MYTCO|nr:unnamed protein product [Mytilus coruscus]